MKKLFFLVSAVFCAVTGIFFSEKLPADTDVLTEEKYDTWAGVIRIWVSEDNSAAGWLNACAAETERAYPGVYINVQEVSDEALREYSVSGVNPPDIMIYPRGLIEDTSLLSPITCTYPLRDGILQEPYAVPVLLRPRFWIYNASVYDTLPGDMYNVNAACSRKDVAALVALSTGLRPAEGTGNILPGVDLGLGAGENIAEAPAGDTACRVSPHIITEESPLALFRRGETDAFIGGIGDALRLADCKAAATGEYAYASEVIMCSIVAKDDGRSEICRAYLDTLMGAGQALAARAQAFPAVYGASAWTGDHLLGPVEAALTGKIWLSGAYDTAPAYLYIEGKISADEAVRRIIGGE